jgi:hypothetical protein
MWIRKSETEIQECLDEEEAKKKSLLRPFLFSLAITVVVVVLFSLGISGVSFRGNVLMMVNRGGFRITTLLAAVFVFALLFVVMLYKQRRGGLFGPSAGDSLLCSDCKEPSHPNSSGRCQCGGQLEPFAFYKWDEEAPAQSLPN